VVYVTVNDSTTGIGSLYKHISEITVMYWLPLLLFRTDFTDLNLYWIKGALLCLF